MGRPIVDRSDQGPYPAVVAAHLHPDRPLGRGGQEIVQHRAHVRMAEPLEARRRRAGWRRPRRGRSCAAGSRHCRGTGRIARSGRRASNCAARRGDEVPTRAPCGKAARLAAPTSRSRTSARGSIAAMASSGGTEGLDVLHRMDGEVDPALEQRQVELPGPQAPCRPARRAAGRAPGRRWWRSARSRSARAPSHGRREARSRPAAPGPAPAGSPGFLGVGSAACAACASGCRGGREARMSLVLGIESSCDETAAALVASDRPDPRPLPGGPGGGAHALRRRRSGDRGPGACRDPSRPDRAGPGRSRGRAGRCRRDRGDGRPRPGRRSHGRPRRRQGPGARRAASRWSRSTISRAMPSRRC